MKQPETILLERINSINVEIDEAINTNQASYKALIPLYNKLSKLKDRLKKYYKGYNYILSSSDVDSIENFYAKPQNQFLNV